MKITHFLFSGLAVLTLGLFAQPSQAAPVIFQFSGLCDDCAADEGLEIAPGENLDDGIYQQVSGELVLFGYTPGDLLQGGKVALDPPPATEEEQEQEEEAEKQKQKGEAKKAEKNSKKKKQLSYFSYNGSALVDAFTLTLAEATVSGQIFADGSLGEDLSIRTKAYSIFLDTDGFWSIIFGRDKKQKQPIKKAKTLDIGVGGALSTPVPAPGALVLLGFGLFGLGLRRSRT